MGIISGLGSFRGLFGDHFRVGDHFGGCTVQFKLRVRKEIPFVLTCAL